MVKINLLSPVRALPRPFKPAETGISISRRSVETFTRSFFSHTNPLLFMSSIQAESKPVGLKNDILAALRTREKYAAEELQSFEQAFDLMTRFHGEERFPDGEKVVVHLLAVARTMAEWGSNPKVVSAALLHLVPLLRLKSETVDKETLHILQRKQALQSYLYLVLDKGALTEDNIAKFTELCLIQEEDRNVWLLEAADQLRTLSSLNEPSERTDLAAYRNYHLTSKILSWFDLDHIAVQLEDVSLFRLNNDEYQRIEKIITDTNKKDRLKALDDLRTLTDLISTEISLPHRVEIDVKSVPRAMKKLEKGEDLTDASRFRIILQGEREDCKKVIKTIKQTMETLGYSEVESERKNYIAGLSLGKKFDFGPKKNGYESLHLHFRGEEYEPINVQIRTEEMHDMAELGSASHGRWKLNGAIGKSAMGTAPAMRRKFLESGRRYVIYGGDLYRLIPYPPNRKLRVIDMLTLIDPAYALRAPLHVGIEKIVPETGEIIRTKVPYDEPLGNADRILRPEKAKKASTVRVSLNILSTLVGQLIHKLAKAGEEFDPEADSQECESAAKRGGNILDQYLIKWKTELEERLASLLRKAGENSKDFAFNPLLSLDTIAGSFGLLTGDELLAKIGLIRRKENIIEHILNITRSSSGTIAIRKKEETGHIDVWALLYDRPGIFDSFLLQLADRNFELVSLSSRRLHGGYAIIKVLAKTKHQAQIDNDLNTFLEATQDLYHLHRPTLEAPRQKEIKVEMSLKTNDFKLIASIISILHKQGAVLVSADFPPVLESKTTGSLRLKLPAGSQDDLNIKISEQLKYPGVKKISVTRL